MSTNEGQLSHLLPRFRDGDPDAIRDVAEFIDKRFKTKLLAYIGKELGKDIRARVDPEDVLQSALLDFFSNPPDLPNRRAMLRYLQETAIHKAANTRKLHRRQKRDVAREVPSDHIHDGDIAGPVSPRSKASRDRTAHSDVKRSYHREQDIAKLLHSSDSFFSLPTLELLAHGLDPAAGAILIDMFYSLREFDQNPGPSLYQIARLAIKGYGNDEIARELGVSRSTIDRKSKLILKRWMEAKQVTIHKFGEPKGHPPIDTIVYPMTTANDLLCRFRLDQYQLSREIQGSPAREFRPQDAIYRLVADGDTLRATPPRQTGE
jgi:DNA-directed RNA polymerase specialized sigma24 family protein